MKTMLAVLSLFCVLPSAEAAVSAPPTPGQCVVAPPAPVRHKRKKRKAKPAVATPAPMPAPTPEPAPAPVQVKEVIVDRPVHVLVPVEKVVTVEKVKVVQAPPPEKTFLVNLHVAAGGGFLAPRGRNLMSTSGLAGLRLKVPAWRSGLEAYLAFDYGVAAQYMFYTYQGERFAHHVEVGMLGLGKRPLSAFDVTRLWDATAGTGVEFRVVGPLLLTADLRASIPSPVFVANNAWRKFDGGGGQIMGEDGRYLDVKHVLGNSFAATQLLLGLLVEF